MLGEEDYRAREPMIDAALAGERQWFAADFHHPTRGLLAVQTEYVPQVDADGTVVGLIMLVQDITEQRVGRARAQGKRGAVPPDRRFGAGADVGDPARPHAATSSTTPMSN